MKKLWIALLVACAASSLYAQAARTFVSGTGMDTGTCASSAPCRSFAYAFSQTATGGDIVALDSAGYNTITITHAVNIIVPPGILGAITVPTSGFGVTVTAGSTDIVRIRGVHFNAGGINATGLKVTAAPKRLELEDSEIDGMSTGIDLPVDTRMYANNVKLSDFGTAVYLHGSSAVASSLMKVTFMNSTLVGGTTGFKVDAGSLIASYVYGFYITQPYAYQNETHVSGCVPNSPFSYYSYLGAGSDLRNGGNPFDYSGCQSP